MSISSRSPLKFGFIMSTEVGLRTQYLNWKANFPEDRGIQPTWIVMTFRKENGWIERLPGIPGALKSRIRAYLEVGEGLRRGPFDATFIAVHSALASRSSYFRRHACFMTFDVTPKQLYGFGAMYGKYPSRNAVIEKAKHAQRSKAYQQCRGLFPWSQWAESSAISDYGASKDNCHIMPPGVDLKAWRPHNVREKEKDAVNILFVGGDFERKGGKLLLDWAAATNLSDWRLNIVTRDKVVSEDSRIRVYNGLSSNDPGLMALYQDADIFALPTLADCYSIAGIEAMACGLPVVLGLSGGTGDIVQDGVTGYLLNGDRPPQLRQSLETLITDRALRTRMGLAARSDCEKRFDVEKNISRTLDIMEASR